jgi:hypothetical protein
MTTVPITVQVDPQVANTFNSVSPAEKRKLEALVSLRLMEATRTTESLEQIMREISRTAQERGLTPEILKAILDEE